MHDDLIAPGSSFDWDAAYARLARVAARVAEIDNPSASGLEKVFRERSARYAGSPTALAEPPYIEAITFIAGESRFAIHATECTVVIPIDEMARLPGVPSFYLGLVSHRGAVYPVIDIRPLLGVRCRHGEDESVRYAILISQGEFALGLAAWEIRGMTKIPVDQIAAGNTEMGSGLHAISGIAPESTLIIDIDSLLRDARLIVDDMPVISSGHEGGKK